MVEPRLASGGIFLPLVGLLVAPPHGWAAPGGEKRGDGDVAESFCLFEVDAELAGFLNKSSMDFCLTVLLPLRPVGLWIRTGEPLMLTKTFVLLTDLFVGAFGPVRPGGLADGRLLGFVLPFRAERTEGEEGVLA